MNPSALTICAKKLFLTLGFNMNTSHLVLWLEAPLQAWGADSKFYRRSTLDFPTKSGILGMILCGMGATGKQSYMLQNFMNLQHTVFSYRKSNRVHDFIPQLKDFQMVGSGYDADDNWESLLIPKTSKGSKSVGGGAKLTYKYYLQDAYFAVIVEIPSHMIFTVEKALTEPYYDIYLGRKSCVPTEFVFQGIYKSEVAAENKAKEIAESKDLVRMFRVLDGVHDGHIMNICDVPIEFGIHKKYVSRQVTLIKDKIPV